MVEQHEKTLVPQIRFAGFTDPWEQRKLENYVVVSTTKNVDGKFGKEDVLSVSGEYGVVNQITFQGRSFAGASVSNYGVVNTGDVVYTKSPLNSNPYGIIKVNKGIPGIVSTLYAIYHPRDNVYANFIQVYFEQHKRMNNYMHPLVNKGAKNDMKVRVIGDITRLDEDIQKRILELEEATKNNSGLNFQIAINYGSRDEITRAVRTLAEDVKEGKLMPEEVNEACIERYLDTHDIPDPDLLIRTSGEQRLSNYLLWQLAYTEFYFTDVPWPDFSKQELEKAIEQYNRRDRRYGGVKEE